MESEQQVATLARETRSSIELSKDAKGEYRWTIKAYFEDQHEDDALATLQRIDSELRRAFLRPAIRQVPGYDPDAAQESPF